MSSHTLHALVGFLLLALFGALMFWLASWVSNRRMLTTHDDDDEELSPAEVASLVRSSTEAADDDGSLLEE